LRDADERAWGGCWVEWENGRGFVAVATTDNSTWAHRLLARASDPARLRVVEVPWSERHLLDLYEVVSRSARTYLDVVSVSVDRRQNAVLVGVRVRDAGAESRLRTAVGEPLVFEQTSGAFGPLV
jgi:hypothetical protein